MRRIGLLLWDAAKHYDGADQYMLLVVGSHLVCHGLTWRIVCHACSYLSDRNGVSTS